MVDPYWRCLSCLSAGLAGVGFPTTGASGRHEVVAFPELISEVFGSIRFNDVRSSVLSCAFFSCCLASCP